MTPSEFQDRFGTNQKVLRQYPRDRWPHEPNERWFLDDAMVLDAIQHVAIPVSSHRPAIPQATNRKPTVPIVNPSDGWRRQAASPPSMTNASQVTDTLTRISNAQSPGMFPVDRLAAECAGIYAWWADDVARQVLGAPLSVALPPLIYVGQAGATMWPSGTRSNATLGSRIGEQHIRGNAPSSTFRLTISALLLDQLHLTSETGRRLQPVSNRLVSVWIAEHLRVAIAPVDDRDQLAVVEADVVSTLDPPLNPNTAIPRQPVESSPRCARSSPVPPSPETIDLSPPDTAVACDRSSAAPPGYGVRPRVRPRRRRAVPDDRCRRQLARTRSARDSEPPLNLAILVANLAVGEFYEPDGSYDYPPGPPSDVSFQLLTPLEGGAS